MKRSLLILSLCCLTCLSGTGTSAPAAPDLKIKVSLNQTSYKTNSAIGIALLIYTPDDAPVTFNSAKIYDLIIKNSAQKIIWRWSAGKMFAQSLTTKVFKASEPLLVSEVIDPAAANLNLEPGEYWLTPVLCLKTAITGEPVRFRIN